MAANKGAAFNFRFTGSEIDIPRRELRRAGAIVHVEPQVFDLLVHLIRHRDRFVPKDELIDAIWEGRIVSEATLSSRISAARRALGDSGNDQSLIRTLYKRGFRFVGDVDEDTCAPAAHVIGQEAPAQGAARDVAALVPAGEPLPLPDEPSFAALPFQSARHDPDQEHVAGGPTAPLPPRRRFPIMNRAPPRATSLSPATARPHAAQEQRKGWRDRAAGCGKPAVRRCADRRRVIAGHGRVAAVVALVTTASTKGPIALAGAAEPAADRLSAQVPSIIVLPFINQRRCQAGLPGRRDHRQPHHGDLVRAFPGNAVVCRDTAFTYKGRGADPRQLGRELGVRYLLAGSVVFEGERVRVNIQLDETKEGSQLWAERFDTERTGIFEVQDEIVGRVSRAIGLKVVDMEARRSSRERPSSAELIDLIMRGKAVLNLPSSPATMIEARGLFEQSLKVEPSNIDGLAGVATTLVFEFLNGYYETGDGERLREAELLLDQAVMIEPRHLMALKAKAALRRTQGKFDDAIAAAEAVVMENPGEPWAYKEIGLSTMYIGRPQKALNWYSKAKRIRKRAPRRWTWLTVEGTRSPARRDEEAIHALISASMPTENLFSHAFLAAAYAHLGRPTRRAPRWRHRRDDPATTVSNSAAFAGSSLTSGSTSRARAAQGGTAQSGHAGITGLHDGLVHHPPCFRRDAPHRAGCERSTAAPRR